VETKKKYIQADWTKWRRKILALSRLDEVDKKDLQIQADWMKWEEKNTFKQSG